MQFNVIDELIDFIDLITGRAKETKTLREIIENLNSSARKLDEAIKGANNGKSGT